MNNRFFFFLVLFAFLSSCKTLGVKKKEHTVSVAYLEEAIKNAHFNFSSLSARLKVHYHSPKNNQSFVLNLRMKKDSIIWLSASLFGIEGVRAILTKDSIKLIDRLNKQYIAQPIAYLQRTVNIQNISFSTLQDIIVGNVLYYQNTSKATSRIDSSYYLLSAITGNFLNNIWLNTGTYKMARNFVQDQAYNQSIDINYADYNSVDKQLFPFKRTIHIKRGYFSSTANLDFSKVEINKKVSFPFKVPEKYNYGR